MKHTLTPLAAVVLAVGLGGATVVHAGTYALGYLNIDNLQLGTDSGIIFNPLSASFTVDSSSSLNGSGISGPAPNDLGDFDVSPANKGDTTKINNDFTPEGPTGNYARADAWLPFTQLDPSGPSVRDDFTQAISISESHLDTTGDGFAQSGNESTTSFNFEFTLASDDRITIDFDAHPYLRTFVQEGSLDPTNASADISASITIAGGGVFYQWSPNGSGLALGFTVNNEAFSLNTNSARDQASFGLEEVDATGEGVADVGVNLGSRSEPNATSPGLFSATSGLLAARDVNGDLITYRLELAMGTRVDVEKTVPEPASLGLFGLGLTALGLLGRRKKYRGEARSRSPEKA